MVIHSFVSAGAEDKFNGVDTKLPRKTCPAMLWAVARRKLELLDSAGALNDLRSPPGNRLEALREFGQVNTVFA